MKSCALAPLAYDNSTNKTKGRVKSIVLLNCVLNHCEISQIGKTQNCVLWHGTGVMVWSQIGSRWTGFSSMTETQGHSGPLYQNQVTRQ